jgi:hypothetical protein
MKQPTKLTRKRHVERDLFAELREGMNALANARMGKRRLRTHSLEFQVPPTKDGLRLVNPDQNVEG